jgi:hypothetical protein
VQGILRVVGSVPCAGGHCLSYLCIIVSKRIIEKDLGTGNSRCRRFRSVCWRSLSLESLHYSVKENYTVET